MRTLALALALLALPAPALADTPDVPDSAFADACDEARKLDACPGCTCELRTQTSPHAKLADVGSPVPIAAILHVSGSRTPGSELADYAADHVVMGTREALAHMGRLAESRNVDDTFHSYEVEVLPQALQWCEGGCAWEAVGVVHPFIVRTSETTDEITDTDYLQHVREEQRVVLCFDGPGGATCAALPIGATERVFTPPHPPRTRSANRVKGDWKRTWKLGKKGDIAIGAARGKLAATLPSPKPATVRLVALHDRPDVAPLAR